MVGGVRSVPSGRATLSSGLTETDPRRGVKLPVFLSGVAASLQSLHGTQGGSRIVGRPFYWQDEDEAVGRRRRAKEAPIVLYQDEFGEGHIHIWVNPSDASRGDFSKCWIDYSGT
jgi:hypothetical protein